MPLAKPRYASNPAASSKASSFFHTFFTILTHGFKKVIPSYEMKRGLSPPFPKLAANPPAFRHLSSLCPYKKGSDRFVLNHCTTGPMNKAVITVPAPMVTWQMKPVRTQIDRKSVV